MLTKKGKHADFSPRVVLAVKGGDASRMQVRWSLGTSAKRIGLIS